MRVAVGERIAVIVNEFGDIGLDHDLIETSTDKLVLMQSGCLCCSIRGDLAETLRRDLLTVLRDAGVTRIVLDYEGGNDNGCIAGRRIEPEAAEELIAARSVATPSQAWDAAAQGWTTVLKDTTVLGAVEDLLIHELGRSVGNWYDGDIETSGEIVWTIGPDSDAIAGAHTTVLRSSETEDWSADPEDDAVTGEDAAAAPAAPSAGG